MRRFLLVVAAACSSKATEPPKPKPTEQVLGGSFFFNSSGDDTLAVRAAIVRIGPPELLPIFDCALTAFPDSKPSADRAVRTNQLARWGDRQFERFGTLDSAVFAMDSIQPAVERFVTAHVAEFPSIARAITN